MNYRGFFWLLIAIATIALLVLAIGYKILHPQPEYDRYLGFCETPATHG